MAQDVRHRPGFAAPLLAVCLSFAVAADALAWGALGHRLICAVALLQLQDDERAEIDRLASRFRGPRGLRYRYFTTGCLFADEARGRARSGAGAWRRFSPFERWHYINVPRRAGTPESLHCGGDCVLTGIEHHFRQFANHDRDDRTRAQAMLFLGHWIADAHQPMHAAFADDFGGNAVDVSGGSFDEPNLHAVWDRGVVDELLGDQDWWAFAKTLSASVTTAERRRWSADPPLEWVAESYRVTTDPRTRYCRVRDGRCGPLDGARWLDGAYRRYATGVARERIRRAGVRLAEYLSRGLR